MWLIEQYEIKQAFLAVLLLLVIQKSSWLPELYTENWLGCVVAGRGSSIGICSSVCLLSYFCHSIQSGHLQVTLCFRCYDASCVYENKHFLYPDITVSFAWSVGLCFKHLPSFMCCLLNQLPHKFHFITLMSILLTLFLPSVLLFHCSLHAVPVQYFLNVVNTVLCSLLLSWKLLNARVLWHQGLLWQLSVKTHYRHQRAIPVVQNGSRPWSLLRIPKTEEP